MGWLIFPFDKPLWWVQDDPLKLWPALPFCALLFFIRWLIDRTLSGTADYLTEYKIEHEKPDFLITSAAIREANIKNGTISAHKASQLASKSKQVSDKERNKLLSLIHCTKLDEQTLFTYASDIKLSKFQIRELKRYVQLVKEYEVHKNKFLESTFKLAALCPIALYGTYVMYFKHDFFIHHWKAWVYAEEELVDFKPCTFDIEGNEPMNQIYDGWLLWYYSISLGYHLNRALTQFTNPSRKDFVALLIHHWTTLALMMGSFMAGNVRNGCVVLAIHECSDIFLESAKVCGYCSLYWVADIFFVFFFLSWVVFRMFFFCQKVLWTVAYCGGTTLWYKNHPLLYPWICVGMLYLLEGLHIYWFTLIMKIVLRKVLGKRIADVRSGSDTESDNEETAKGKTE
mmetsp:Transcript_67691/g.107438  ORF Transcript_67691/g.107438 Transcript_67691/m.107438 type:complete len:400 (-) Transcript_67691:90-1289(-)